MNINRSDVIWNYAASFLKIAATALLLPFILHKMPTEMVGIWTIFMTITSFVVLVDFGFSPSFSRNITYIFRGVKVLKINGFEQVNDGATVDYGLLKGAIIAMRWFYFRAAVVLFFLLITGGTYYIHFLLKEYSGSRTDVYISWFLLCAINTYNIFTLYYESLLTGKGLVKRSKQIVIAGQSVYLSFAIGLILMGYGLVAIVSAQALSVIIIRFLSYRSFFTSETRQLLDEAIPHDQKAILKATYPNAVKVGITTLGGLLVQKSAMVIGSLYLSLTAIASYGITMQLISLIAFLASIYTRTYLPKIAFMRIEGDNNGIKDIYLKGQAVMLITFVAGAIGILFLGEQTLHLIGSQTHLMAKALTTVAIIVAFLDTNHSIAGSILLSKNEVPYFKASIAAGTLTIILLFSLLHSFPAFRLWAMIIAPGIAQAIYQNWKWPAVVVKELKITFKDVLRPIITETESLAKAVFTRPMKKTD